VHRVKVEVYQAIPTGVAQPLRRGDHVQAVVEIGELAAVVRYQPRLVHHDIHHHRAVDAFHHDLGPARAHLVDLRYGIAVLARVGDDPSLALDHATALGASQHEAGPELEDVA